VSLWNSVLPFVKPLMQWIDNWRPATHSSLPALFGALK
jgi:hypothetical protein